MLIQLATVLFVIGITYIFFRAFGPRGEYLFLSRDEKRKWDEGLKGKLGTWVTLTNISGTITSFATVLFLMGSVKLFGLFSLSTGVTIVVGAIVTNYFTRRLVSNRQIRERIAASDQTTGVIAFLLWNDSPRGRHLASVTKWVSIVAISSIVWVEFLIFARITSVTLGVSGPWYQAIVMFSIALIVIYFVLRYGIRGFTFADFLHGPLIAMAALVLGGAVVLIFGGPHAPWSEETFVEPILSLAHGIVFALHVLVFNCLQVLCTEPHWLRVWLFGKRETTTQLPAMAATGVLWLVMLFIGFTAAASSGGIGESAVLALVDALGDKSPVLIAVFWIAFTAALFSTADTQAYCVLLVSKFNPSTGVLTNIPTTAFKPMLYALASALVCAGAYLGTHFTGVPIEKIIFVVLPSVVTLAPPIVVKALGRAPHPLLLWISLLGYWACAGLGFLRPNDEFFWTLSAVFVPAGLAVAAIVVVILRGPMTKGA